MDTRTKIIDAGQVRNIAHGRRVHWFTGHFDPLLAEHAGLLRQAFLEAQRAAAGGRHTAEELVLSASAAPFCASSSEAQRAAAGGRHTAEELVLSASAAPFCASSSEAQRAATDGRHTAEELVISAGAAPFCASSPEAQRAATDGRHTAEELVISAGAAPFCAGSPEAQRAASGGRHTAEELVLSASAAPFCASSSEGHILVVEITNPPQPLLTQRARAELVAALADVSYVVMTDREASPPDMEITRRFIQHVHERSNGGKA